MERYLQGEIIKAERDNDPFSWKIKIHLRVLTLTRFNVGELSLKGIVQEQALCTHLHPDVCTQTENYRQLQMQSAGVLYKEEKGNYNCLRRQWWKVNKIQQQGWREKGGTEP